MSPTPPEPWGGGREANTIGSKASDLEITRAVIGVKSELESLREQVQNVE